MRGGVIDKGKEWVEILPTGLTFDGGVFFDRLFSGN
jgi:hypothetical protein